MGKRNLKTLSKNGGVFPNRNEILNRTNKKTKGCALEFESFELNKT